MESKLLNGIRAMPMAADLWLMIAVVLHAFGKPIPWYLWVMLALEILVCIRVGHAMKGES